MIGKPYSGKPNVRFDEGELEIELLATTPDLYSTESARRNKWAEVYSGRINFCYKASVFQLLKMFGFDFHISMRRLARCGLKRISQMRRTRASLSWWVFPLR